MRYYHGLYLWFWFQLAVQNALRYFPPSAHCVLAPEFVSELRDYGHIYMYRLLPDFPVR
jgi:urocanate hydratase